MKRFFANICISDMPTDEVIERAILAYDERTTEGDIFHDLLMDELTDREPERIERYYMNDANIHDLQDYFEEV